MEEICVSGEGGDEAKGSEEVWMKEEGMLGGEVEIKGIVGEGKEHEDKIEEKFSCIIREILIRKLHYRKLVYIALTRK